MRHFWNHLLNKYRRVFVKAVAAMVVACMTLSSTAAAIYATTAQDKLNNAQSDLNNAQQQVDTYQQKQDQVQSEISDAQAQLAGILSELDVLESDIADTQEQVDQAAADLADAEEREQQQYDSMKLRIQYMYENNQTTSIWQAILEADGFVDMLNRLEYVSDVYNADREMMDKYEAAVEEVTERKQAYEDQLDTLLYQQSVFIGQQEEVESLIATLGEKANEYATQLANAQAMVSQYQQTIAEQQAIIEAEAKRQQEEAEAKARKEAEEKAAKEAAEKAASEAAESERLASEAAQKASESASNTDTSGSSSDTGNTSGSSSDTGSSSSSSSDSGSSSSSSGSSSSGKTNNGTGVSGSDIVSYALQFVGNPYVWGGNSLTNGCDCSGFVHLVYAHFGISTPRYSMSFATGGIAVSRSNIQAGDVVVYNNHVAIYIGNGCIVEAQSTRAGITSNRSVDCSTIVAIRRYV